MKTEILFEPRRSVLDDVITIEQYQKRKLMRRRRVAKRKLLSSPLFAIEEMQAEFQGYTYDEWIDDITRKTRKGKKLRKSKRTGFDWKEIREKIPSFFYKCVKRSKTRATLRGRSKNGVEFIAEVRSIWFDGNMNKRMWTNELIKLWQADNLKEFLRHPAVLVCEVKSGFTFNN